MARFYQKNLGKHKKEFIKIYSKIPDHLPKALKGGKLIAYDVVEIINWPFSSKNCKIRYQEHALTNQEKIDKMLQWQCVEITEEKYNTARDKIKELISKIDNVYQNL